MGYTDVWEHFGGERHIVIDWSPIIEDLYSPELAPRLLGGVQRVAYRWRLLSSVPGTSVHEACQFPHLCLRDLEANGIPHHSIETKTVPEVTGRPASCVHFVQGVSKEKRQSFEIETELCGICALEGDYLVKEATHELMDDIDSVKEHDEFHYLNFSCSMPEMMKRYHERVVDYTTPNFNGIISMMDPSRSWVAREPRIRRFVPGCYTLAVAEALPEDLQNLCKASKATLEQAAGGETPLSSPERQATTAMPLRISRTPLQLGTIPSGNFHPHAHIPFITIAVQCMELGSIVTSMAAAATLKARALKEIWNVATSVTAEAAPDRKHKV
ncbi:Transcription elongation factor SPT4-like 1 [Vitis vinifera]|uniref:Transcription elongation factor SPT4-like 1 n=1 Tax=Vitis vinifera TaxID=29760 RepID=A0A438G450_VITVI|nr:Transcription elongation factor SPT4-like 1 [Vitis vinifera]